MLICLAMCGLTLLAVCAFGRPLLLLGRHADAAVQNATCICNFCKPIPRYQFGRLGLAGFLVVLILGVLLLLLVLFLVMRANQLTIMHIPFSELHLSEDSEVLGEGMHGKVLRGEYRGTQVAVKRMMSPHHPRSKHCLLLLTGLHASNVSSLPAWPSQTCTEIMLCSHGERAVHGPHFCAGIVG